MSAAETDPLGCVSPNACNGAGACVAPAGAACTANGQCLSNVCFTGVTAFDGASTAGFTLNGEAAFDAAAGVLKLTSGANNQAGSAFFSTPTPGVDFDLSFEFRITPLNGRADGLMFVLQTDSANAVGGFGASMGSFGLHGFGVEVDDFDNMAGSGCGDSGGNGNHAGIDKLAPLGCGITPFATSADLFSSFGDMADGTFRAMRVHVAGGAASVSLGPTVANQAPVPNLQNVALVGYSSGVPYFFGFTAGTGGLAAQHAIRNVVLTLPTGVCR